MFDKLTEALDTMLDVVADIEPKALDDEVAVRLVEMFVRFEQASAAGRVLATQALQHSDVWRREGFRSAAAWMAAKAGAKTGVAAAALEMAGLLGGLPAVAAAFRGGRLSEAQAGAIADAASEYPDAEAELVEAAGKLSLRDLQEECRRVKAAADTDEERRHGQIRRGRYCRSWTDRDGAVRLSARLPADEGARVLAQLDARCYEVVAEAYQGRWFESMEAHRADAFVDLLCTPPDPDHPGPAAMVHVVVDAEALRRGGTVPGERCEIPGVGPIAVAVARRLLGDAVVKILVTEGVDITAVAHGGRTVPAHLRTALEIRDAKCIVPRCPVRRDLQIDHRQPWAAGGPTTLDNLARLCRWHHYQKSHLGYRYRGGPGSWEWIPPETTQPP